MSAGDRAGVAAMVAATLLWGGTFVVIRDSVGAIPPVTLVCARFAVASVPLLAIAWLRRRRGAGPLPWRGGALAGLCYAGGFAFQAIGLTTTSAGSSGFLTFVGTALAAVWAWVLFGQRPAAAVVVGLLAALTGSALLSSGGVPGRGEAWTLLGAALFGAQIVVLSRFAPGADPLALTAVQSVVMVAALVPFAGGWSAFRTLDGATWARFAYLALAGSLIATTLQTWAQARLPAGRVALLFGLEPVFALAFALAAGGERFVPRWWLGAALILGGVLFSEWRSSRASRPATS